MSERKDLLDAQTRTGLQRYWRNNKRIIGAFLVIWFLISYVFAIFLVEPLNAYKLGGFPLGFWIAQQGSIYLFIVIIGAYCWLMEYGDKKFHLEEQKRQVQETKE